MFPLFLSHFQEVHRSECAPIQLRSPENNENLTELNRNELSNVRQVKRQFSTAQPSGIGADVRSPTGVIGLARTKSMKALSVYCMIRNNAQSRPFAIVVTYKTDE